MIPLPLPSLDGCAELCEVRQFAGEENFRTRKLHVDIAD